MRRTLALGLSYALALAPLLGQQVQQDIAPVRPQGAVVLRPYRPVEVPGIRTANSGRLGELLRAGKLYLTAHDAILIALENNIDIEIARYSKVSQQWQLERALSGGALPGVPSTSSQAFSVAAGQGVQGATSSAGVSSGGGGGGSTTSAVAQVGPVTQNLDTLFSESTTFSHQTTPQQNTTLSGTLALQDNTRAYTATVQQGLITGGSATLTYKNNYLGENSPTDLLNPTVAPNLSISIQHNLLRSFGTSVNGRTIRISRINLANTDLNFKTQVTNLVVNVLNTYYGLVSDYEDVAAKSSALDAAKQFYEESQKRLEFGTLTPLDVTSAEVQVVTGKQALDISQTSLDQQELQLKNLLSRTGIAAAGLADVRIVPLDRIAIPDHDDIPPLQELVAQALEKRSDLQSAQVALRTNEISLSGTRNGILPTAQVFASTSDGGLAGTAKPYVIQTPRGPVVVAGPNPYFIGGVGDALGQVFRRNFPSENAGAVIAPTIHNRQAQADFGIDQLQFRQQQLSTRKGRNQAEVDILNAVIALQQSRAKYESAVRNRILNEELLKAEQRKYALGASTPYLVVQQQRDLVNATSQQIAALTGYSQARVALDQATGNTLETNGITVDEARAGKAAAESKLPVSLPPTP